MSVRDAYVMHMDTHPTIHMADQAEDATVKRYVLLRRFADDVSEAAKRAEAARRLEAALDRPTDLSHRAA